MPANNTGIVTSFPVSDTAIAFLHDHEKQTPGEIVETLRRYGLELTVEQVRDNIARFEACYDIDDANAFDPLD